MLKHQLIVAIILLVGGAGIFTGCNQADVGESQVREEPGMMEDRYVEEDVMMEDERTSEEATESGY